MQVFVYEHITASADRHDPALASLRAEGAVMLHTVAEDLARIAGVTVVTVADAAESAFRAGAACADYTLVIAPEFEDILASRCRWVLESGGRLLGPAPEAVRLTADKWALSEHWQAHGVPTPPCRLLLPGAPPPSIVSPVVCKPRAGAGSLATFLVEHDAQLAEVEHTGDLVMQPYVPGVPASVGWLIGPVQHIALMPARQLLSDDGRFHYLGGQLPLDDHLRERAVSLSRAAITCVPGLAGYVGVDLVLGEARDGSQDVAIELNPRLTTSYVGLRVLARDNLADLMLRLVRGETVTPPTWHPGTVRFTAAGTIRYPSPPP